KALDRTKVSKEAFSAWRHVVDAGNRWVVTRDDDVEQLIDFLLSLLPTHTCVYVELQSIAGEKERLTAEQREHRFWSRITVSRSERLRIKAYDYGDGPNWRYRPAGEKADDCREWMHLRLCKLPWPGEESRLERCPGYTRALQCWRVSHDLREPKWARYRR
ncbi:MAG TPA: hypothetical protein VMV99_07980, partial [Rhodanobacter sp.]|nr:hypothetical protein [Rhodanobacter sp.]